MADTSRTWTAALLIIGDEILSGRTQDKNVAQVAAWLNVQGIRLDVTAPSDIAAAVDRDDLRRVAYGDSNCGHRAEILE